jgi:hypothetical protein
MPADGRWDLIRHLKPHFLFRNYQVNGFVLFGKIIGVDFYSAFTQLVCLPNVPITVHCTSSQVNNCCTVPTTCLFGRQSQSGTLGKSPNIGDAFDLF